MPVNPPNFQITYFVIISRSGGSDGVECIQGGFWEIQFFLGRFGYKIHLLVIYIPNRKYIEEVKVTLK